MSQLRNGKTSQGREKQTKYDSFKTRMEILAALIEAGQALTPTQISHGTQITHYPGD